MCTFYSLSCATPSFRVITIKWYTVDAQHTNNTEDIIVLKTKTYV